MELIRQAGRLIGVKNKQYETLTEVSTQGYKVRIWRTAKSLSEAKTFDHAVYRNLMLNILDTTAREFWAEMLMKLPRVACVAIVDQDGNGVSCYPDWG